MLNTVTGGAFDFPSPDSLTDEQFSNAFATLCQYDSSAKQQLAERICTLGHNPLLSPRSVLLPKEFYNAIATYLSYGQYRSRCAIEDQKTFFDQEADQRCEQLFQASNQTTTEEEKLHILEQIYKEDPRQAVLKGFEIVVMLSDKRYELSHGGILTLTSN
jgi:hypothetical protein